MLSVALEDDVPRVLEAVTRLGGSDLWRRCCLESFSRGRALPTAFTIFEEVSTPILVAKSFVITAHGSSRIVHRFTLYSYQTLVCLVYM